MEQDTILKRNVENVFVDKSKADVAQPHVLAAMITAASEMSRESEGIATPEMTTEELLDLYGKTEDGQVTSLLGMSSAYIQLNTGYSVQVEDMGAASANYRAQKPVYDMIYGQIAERARVRQEEKGITK